MRDVKQEHANYSCAGEENDRSDQAREIFPDHQDFTPHRAKKVKVQTAVNNVAAEQIHKYPGTAKENNRPQNQSAVINRKDHVVLSEVLPLAARRRKWSQQRERHNRNQRQQIEQN